VPYIYLYFYTSYKKFRMEKKYRPPYLLPTLHGSANNR
jgi:hypothetical protein